MSDTEEGPTAEDLAAMERQALKEKEADELLADPDVDTPTHSPESD